MDNHGWVPANEINALCLTTSIQPKRHIRIRVSACASCQNHADGWIVAKLCVTNDLTNAFQLAVKVILKCFVSREAVYITRRAATFKNRTLRVKDCSKDTLGKFANKLQHLP